MTIMPGAAWRPITVPGGLVKRTPGRGVILHVAASEATSLFGFFNGNTSANSHFYVAKNGTIEQYIDTAYQSWASMTANKNTISVETQGGVTNPDGEPWTAAQVASLSRICAWAHATEGVPLTLMPNSLPGSRGIGYHRLGIDPWRIAGGEVWSSSRGKVCPGTAKIAQVPAVIAAALGGDDVPLTQADIAAIWNYAIAHSDSATSPAPAWLWLRDAREAQAGYGARIERIDEGLHGGWGYGTRIEDIEAKVTALAGGIDPQALADLIVAKLPAQPAAAGGLTKDDVTAAVKSVFAAAGQP